MKVLLTLPVLSEFHKSQSKVVLNKLNLKSSSFLLSTELTQDFLFKFLMPAEKSNQTNLTTKKMNKKLNQLKSKNNQNNKKARKARNKKNRKSKSRRKRNNNQSSR